MSGALIFLVWSFDFHLSYVLIFLYLELAFVLYWSFDFYIPGALIFIYQEL